MLLHESIVNCNVNSKYKKSFAQLGNAIPDRFANPGISGLSLLNPGIQGLIRGLNRPRLWLAIAGLVVL